MKSVKLCFDTEFTELSKNGELISIGIVPMNDKLGAFYAEISDYDKSSIVRNQWMQENVINNLSHRNKSFNNYLSTSNNTMSLCGMPKGTISVALIKYLERIRDSAKLLFNITEEIKIEFISDVCHYDMMYLIDLITNGKTAFDLPKFISPACYDINNDIANYLDNDRYLYNRLLFNGFDKNREELVKEFILSNRLPNLYNPIPEIKHNALYDAYVIRDIFIALNE